jgi:hypothetical protein
VQDAHAGFAVSNQCFTIAITNLGREQIKIAAKIEHAGRPRPEQQISQVVRTVAEGSKNAALPGMKVFQEIEVVARPAARPHERPQRASQIVPGNFQLFQLEQPARVGALLQIDELRIGRQFRWCGCH